MNADQTVQPGFVPVAAGFYALTVHDYGEGTIISSPSGIDCGANCSADFRAGSEVTLQALPDSNYRFEGWSGACVGESNCVVFMDNAAFVNALFVPGVPTVPTLSQWALMLLGSLILMLAYREFRTTIGIHTLQKFEEVAIGGKDKR